VTGDQAAGIITPSGWHCHGSFQVIIIALSERGPMSHTEAGFDVLHRVLLVLLVCLALLLLVGCSGDPECFACALSAEVFR
jgi:hypothetical protein